jgi:cytochrome b561
MVSDSRTEHGRLQGGGQWPCERGQVYSALTSAVHGTVGNVFYAVIAVHALAALWHQFVRRDGVLRRMW